MLKPTKVKIVKKIYSFSPSREGCILVLRVEDVRSKQNEIGSIGEGVVFHEVLIDNSRRVQRRKKYYCLLPIASACAHTPTMYYVVMCARVRNSFCHTPILILFETYYVSLCLRKLLVLHFDSFCHTPTMYRYVCANSY